MNSLRCRFENETMQMLRSGACSAELARHHEGCDACRQTIAVAHALRQDAAGLAADYTPLPAAQVLAAADRHRRAAALARATRFFNLLKIAGLVYAAVFALWGLHALSGHTVVISGFDIKSMNLALEGAALAAIVVGSGLWYAMRPDRIATD